MAASLAFTIQNQDSLVDLMFVGPRAYCFTAGRGVGHIEQILEVLASVQFSRRKQFCLAGTTGGHPCRRIERMRLRVPFVGPGAAAPGQGPSLAQRPAAGFCAYPFRGVVAAGGHGRRNREISMRCPSGRSPKNWRRYEDVSILIGRRAPVLGLGNPVVPAGGGDGGGPRGFPLHPPALGISDAELNRICALCWVLFLGAGLVLYSTEDRLIFIFKFIQWLPMTFFPIMLAQAYGTREAIPLSVFLWLPRRAPYIGLARKPHNISFAYFAVCVAAASASTQPNGYFYWGVCILVLLAMTSVRPRRVSRFVWLVLIAGVALAGQSTHQQLRRLQNAMEGALGGWLAEMFRQPQDSREWRTQIGAPGRIKQSSKIVMRVRLPPGEIPPSLLREAAYDSYKNETWWATSNDFTAISMGGPTNDTVRLMAPKKVSSAVEIARYLHGGQGPLALPHGTFELDDLPAVACTNRLGVAEIQAGPGLVNFYARYGGGASLDCPPGPVDLVVSENERPTLDKVADSLGLKQCPSARESAPSAAISGRISPIRWTNPTATAAGRRWANS